MNDGLDRSQFKVIIPIKINDYVKINDFDNNMFVEDILVIHFKRSESVKVLLLLKDIDTGWMDYFNYDDFKYTVVNMEGDEYDV